MRGRITIRSAAGVLGVAENLLRRLAREGRLECEADADGRLLVDIAAARRAVEEERGIPCS